MAEFNFFIYKICQIKCKVGTKTFPFLMANVTHMLLVIFIYLDLIQSSLLTSLAPGVLQWKDVQSMRRVQLKH